jgi:hypothetical protein
VECAQTLSEERHAVKTIFLGIFTYPALGQRQHGDPDLLTPSGVPWSAPAIKNVGIESARGIR